MHIQKNFKLAAIYEKGLLATTLKYLGAKWLPEKKS